MVHGLSCSVACGIFPDQDSNLCPLHWQADSQPLRHQGSPNTLNIYNYVCQLFLNKFFKKSTACLSRPLRSWLYICFIVIFPTALHQALSAPVHLISSSSSSYTTFIPGPKLLLAVSLLVPYHHQYVKMEGLPSSSAIQTQAPRPSSGPISSTKLSPLHFYPIVL